MVKSIINIFNLVTYSILVYLFNVFILHVYLDFKLSLISVKTLKKKHIR